MNLLRRFEVWLLLLLGAGVGIWVLTVGPNEAGPGQGPAEGGSGQDAIKVHRVTLERDYGNARLDIELRFQNNGPRTLVLQAPDVRLLTAEGGEVPPFVLPTESPPEIPPGREQDVRLRYWLDQTQLLGRLTLDIRGQQAAVKGAGPLDLEKLENRRAKIWNGPISGAN